MALSKTFKKLILRICELNYYAKEGHVPSALSILNIVWTIYNDIIDNKLIKLNSHNRDYFVLSKGHGCLALYAVLENKKIIKGKELDNFCKFKSKFGGHPDHKKILGIEASTGSLGHGFPIASGIAYALKLKKKKSKVYVIIGDGECNEGTIWETCLLAAHHKLNNLTCIIDKNLSTDRALKIDSLRKKFISFGWNAIECDGHNNKLLKKYLNKKSKKPFAIIANTIKGHGIKFMENDQHEWHHKIIDKNKFLEIKNLLNF
jgi:transketolase